MGGISGYINGITISSCYNMGNVKGEQRVGGISGEQKGRVSGSSVTSSRITYCYNANENISGSKFVGSICGYQNSEYASIISSGFLKSNSNLYGIAYDYNTSKYNLNTGCSSYTSLESMPTVLSVINSDNAFVEDTEGINNGYPLLAWQVEATD